MKKIKELPLRAKVKAKVSQDKAKASKVSGRVPGW